MNQVIPSRHLLITLLILVLASGFTFCQDIVFKKDGTILNASIKSFDGKTIIYEVPGDTTHLKYYLSSSLTDSLKYSDGRKTNFRLSDEKHQQPKHDLKNYLELDAFHLWFGDPYITYERLSSDGRNSFLTALFVNLGTRREYYDRSLSESNYLYYEPFTFFARVGYNHYPFNYSLSNSGNCRIGSGLSFIMGSMRRYEWTPSSQTFKNVFVATLVANMQCKFYLDDKFQIYLGLDGSIFPFLSFICPQVGLSACF